MRSLNILSLFATLASTQLSSSYLGQTTNVFADPSISCEGTSTFTGYIPMSTVTVTVDGNYTYTGATNDSIPSIAIFYTPPPACASIVVSESSTTLPSTFPSISNATNSSSSYSPELTPSPPPIPSIVPALPSESTVTRTETITDTICGTSIVNSNSTIKTGAPYANSSTPFSSNPSCSTTVYTTTSIETFSVFTSAFGSYSASPRLSAETSAIQGTLSPVPAPPPPAITASSSNGIQPMIPPPASTANGAPPEFSAVSSEARSSVATVTVTKKTPVVAPATNSGPQIAFPDETGVGSPNKVTATKSPTNSGSSSNGGNNNSPTAGNSNPTNGNNNSNGGNSPTQGNNNSPNTGNANPQPSSTGGGGLGSIINSAFNSPWTSIGVSTSLGAASATVTLVNGVPVQVSSSSVYIGGSYVALPAASSTAYVTINGQTFTVEATAIIGSSTTLQIERPESISYSPVQAATLRASTITQGGVVVTIEPTAAVIDGTTYAIGLNAQATTVVINGQTIILNSNGVAFPSTTYLPAMTTAAAYLITTIGDLTFSIDPSEAIISGTTYRIGAGALNSVTTTVIDGTTVIFGPSGIILPSTTVAPTGVSLSTSNTHTTRPSSTARVVSEPTATATSSDNAATSIARSPTHLSNSICAITMLLSLVTLPLSLLL